MYMCIYKKSTTAAPNSAPSHTTECATTFLDSSQRKHHDLCTCDLPPAPVTFLLSRDPSLHYYVCVCVYMRVHRTARVVLCTPHSHPRALALVSRGVVTHSTSRSGHTHALAS